MAKVEILSFDELPDWIDKEYLSDNGAGKQYAGYLIITDGDYRVMYSDAMEPEDVKFYRDLSWVKDELIRAYVKSSPLINNDDPDVLDMVEQINWMTQNVPQEDAEPLRVGSIITIESYGKDNDGLTMQGRIECIGSDHATLQTVVGSTVFWYEDNGCARYGPALLIVQSDWDRLMGVVNEINNK